VEEHGAGCVARRRDIAGVVQSGPIVVRRRRRIGIGGTFRLGRHMAAPEYGAPCLARLNVMEGRRHTGVSRGRVRNDGMLAILPQPAEESGEGLHV
jgi:hypothetical protein